MRRVARAFASRDASPANRAKSLCFSGVCCHLRRLFTLRRRRAPCRQVFRESQPQFRATPSIRSRFTRRPRQCGNSRLILVSVFGGVHLRSLPKPPALPAPSQLTAAPASQAARRPAPNAGEERFTRSSRPAPSRRPRHQQQIGEETDRTLQAWFRSDKEPRPVSAAVAPAKREREPEVQAECAGRMFMSRPAISSF